MLASVRLRSAASATALVAGLLLSQGAALPRAAAGGVSEVAETAVVPAAAPQRVEARVTMRPRPWVSPVEGHRLTGRFGDVSGLWSSGAHTGLDFAVAAGTPIRSVTDGRVTSAAYEGAYGNHTVVRLEDGTEVWYSHQTSIVVSPGERVRAGQVIGYVGSTGNVTGPHLHLEVHAPGRGAVDPETALAGHGVRL